MAHLFDDVGHHLLRTLSAEPELLSAGLERLPFFVAKPENRLFSFWQHPDDMLKARSLVYCQFRILIFAEYPLKSYVSEDIFWILQFR